MNSKIQQQTRFILKFYPESRDSLGVFFSRFIFAFLDGDYERLSEISPESYIRERRRIQNDELIYVPSERVKEARERKQEEYREHYSKAVK